MDTLELKVPNVANIEELTNSIKLVKKYRNAIKSILRWLKRNVMASELMHELFNNDSIDKVLEQYKLGLRVKIGSRRVTIYSLIDPALCSSITLLDGEEYMKYLSEIYEEGSKRKK